MAFGSLAVAAKRPFRPQPPLPLPDGLKIPVYTPGPVPFHPGEELLFRASWAGIPAADARIVLRTNAKNPAEWSGEAWISSSRLVDLLYKMRNYVREDFSATSLVPRDIYIAQRENKRYFEYLVNFNRSAGVVTMVRRNKRGSDTHRFKADNPWGPISGALMALSQPLEVGQKLVFDVFMGRNRYVISFDVARREQISTPLGDFDALRIVPTMVYLSDSEARKKARETTLWISADDRHLPLRIEAAAFIGKLRADLIQVSDFAPPAPVAQARDSSPRATATASSATATSTPVPQ